MKFLRMFNHRIMNEADDLGSDGGGASDVSDFSSQSIMGSDNDEDIFKEHGLDFKKYGFDEDDNSEESLEDELPEGEIPQGAGQGTDENALLEKINALGAIHNGNPLKVESIDDLKNLVQMGKDYTLKTQSLSDERKAWETERTTAESEVNQAIQELNTSIETHKTQLQELQQWTFALNQLKESAPDVFEEVQRAYEGTVKQFSNPVLDQQLAAIRAELAETKKSLSSRENKLIVDEFERDKGAMSATEQSLKELGVNIDWAEVKKEWASSGMPVNKVVGALYFDSIAKAQASKAKVETTKAKVTARPVAAANKSRPGGKVKAIDPKLTGLAYASALLDRYSN
jgi:hypothetical protein